MIRPFSGEFTVSPIPLEMAMNYCSHKCLYCFANLNQPNRTFDIKGFISQIKNCHKNNSLTSYLLREGYPVLLSNLVDPFAKSNYRQTLTAIDLIHANGNKIVFQTKGGDGIDEALEKLNYKTNWYISISTLDDKIRKRIEPGAPTIESRLELIKKLKAAGHDVSVAINPLEQEWCDMNDIYRFIDIFKELGIKDLWVESLHFNHNQIKRMSDKEKKALTEEVIFSANKIHIDYTYQDHCMDIFIANGFNVFSINQERKSTFFDNYHKNHKTLKTNQDFINYCFDKYPNGGEIKFAEYYNFMKQDYFELKFNECDGMIYRIARNIYKRLENKPFKTIKSVLECYWEEIEISKSLFNNRLFSILSYHDENGKEYEYRCKENGMLIYWFNGKVGSERHFIE